MVARFTADSIANDGPPTRILLAAAIGAVLALVATVAAIPAPAHATSGTVYFVDSVGGSDSNSGTSATSAWQSLSKVSSVALNPGDQVLFDSGETFSGQLLITSSGSTGSPILIGSYGSGARPILAGGGVSSAATLTLRNAHDITVNGLEITNSAGSLSTQVADTRGVFVDANNMGADEDITLENLYVHNIDGWGWSSFGQGGIVTMAQGSTTPTYFDTLHIINNVIANSNEYGLSMVSNWCGSGCAVFAPLSGDNDAYGAFTPSTNVVIQGNYVHDVTGAGIQSSTTQSAVIENNTVDRAATNRLSLDGPSGTSYSSVRSGGNVGIWWQNDVDTLVQYNSVSNTALGDFLVDDQDDQGYDSDEGTEASVVQYNYSYNNAGGFYFDCCSAGGGQDATVRYNVSNHDLYHTFSLPSGSTRVRVYNNTIWSTADTEPQGTNPTGGSTVQVGVKTIVDTSYDGIRPGQDDIGFFNNIFYNPAHVAYNALGGAAHYSHNLYYDGSGVTPQVPAEDLSAVTSSPILSSPGTATYPTAAQTAAQLATFLAGYAETGSSPSRNAGVTAGAMPPADLFGAAVPPGAPDLGASQHSVTVSASTSLGTGVGAIADIAANSATPTGGWTSANSAIAGGTVTLTYSEPRLIDTVSVATNYGQDQGITSADVQAWNGTSWVTQVSNVAISWKRNDATIEWFRIPLPTAVTTSEVQLVIHTGNTSTWGHIAIDELWASYGTFASTSQTSYSATPSVQTTVDGNLATSWATGSAPTTDAGVSVDLGAPVTAGSMNISAAYGQGQGPTNVTIWAKTPLGLVAIASNYALTWTSNTSTVETLAVPLSQACYSTGSGTTCLAASSYIMRVNSWNNTWGHWAVNEISFSN